MIDNDEKIMLGNSIALVGFNDIDGGSMIILKKMVGNHVRKICELSDKFEDITLTMKKIGSGENKFQINAKMIAEGKPVTSEVTDFNMFMTVDKVLRQVQSQMVR